MNFGLSEEQQLLQETVAQFLDNECPVNQLRARSSTRRTPATTRALWKGFVETGDSAAC